MITTILLRIPVAYTLAYFTRSESFPNGRPEALFASLLISWSMGALISFIVFRRGKWKKTAFGADVRAQLSAVD